MKCQYCGAELEESATFCETCGTQNGESAPPSTPEKIEPKRIVQTLVSLIFIGLCIWALIYTSNPDNNLLGIHDMKESYKIAKKVISEELLSPSSAKYPAFSADFVTQRSELMEYEGYSFRVRTVTAYVDSKNAFGVMVRNAFQVKIGLSTDSNSDLYYYEIIYLE